MFNKKICDIDAYPVKAFDYSQVFKLNASENHFVGELYEDFKFDFKKTNFYPDSNCTKLGAKLSETFNISLDNLAFGNGSDEIIDILISLFVNEEERIIINTPTFPMYKYFAKVRGREVKEISRRDDFSIDVEYYKKHLDARDKLIFVDSPGNPSGQIICEEELTSLLETGLIVVLDEAYVEFSSQNYIHLQQRFHNLIIVRSFSKWAGLAGVRIGYMIAHPQIVAKYNSIRPVFNVNSVAQAMAEYAVENIEKFKIATQNLLECKNLIIDSLNHEKYLVVRTHTPFILMEVLNTNKQKIADYLEINNVIVKYVRINNNDNYISFCPPPRANINKLIVIFNNFNN